jgi:antitoxin component of MazEF toxin-antitoxin module
MSRSFEIDKSRPITEVKFRKTGGSLSVIWSNANAVALHVTDGSVARIAYTKTGEQIIIPITHSKTNRKYSFADLLSEMAEQVDLSANHTALEQMRPAGNESNASWRKASEAGRSLAFELFACRRSGDEIRALRDCYFTE